MTILKLSSFAGLILAIGATTPVQAQQPANHSYDAWFTKWDRNKDGFLDAEELAKAYRGLNAKVIADKAGAKETHPEHLFLSAWDANKDGKLSMAEYEKYEAKSLADARASANRNRTYSRGNRVGYRSPMRHRGFAGRGVGGRGFGSNPYTAMLRYQQRAYQMQRSAYSNLMRYGVYSPSVRGGYRGKMAHNHRGRRR